MPENVPEYLLLFGNAGDYEVIVKFKEKSMSIVSKRMSAVEFQKLMDPTNNSFFQKMTFDEHPFIIEKYELFPQNKRIVIHAKRDQ